ncbi:MAG: LysR family transcriptional regulator [Syntrophobacteraceae bacterium]|nr:LysR family transcriptional regulator [Syntrophobacteraceae bacterium]
MDIHRLEVFCRVVDLRSFTKAADAVYLTQPTVSEHVRALEEMVGEKLLDRLGREVLPTPAGKILYRYARNIIQMRDEAVQALESYKGNLSGHLFIGAGTIPGTYILPELLGSFKSLFPSIQTTLIIAGSSQIVSRLLEGSIELGLVGAKWNDRRILSEEIFSDELVLTVYPGHPWAGRTQIPLHRLMEEPFIQRERGSGTRIVLEQVLSSHGFDPSQLHVIAEMGSTEAVRQGIKARIGVSILSYQAVAEDIDRSVLATVGIEGVRFLRPFYLVRRKKRQPSPLGTAFVEHLHAQAEAKLNRRPG